MPKNTNNQVDADQVIKEFNDDLICEMMSTLTLIANISSMRVADSNWARIHALAKDTLEVVLKRVSPEEEAE